MIGVAFVPPWWWPALCLLPLLAWAAWRGERQRAAARAMVIGRREQSLLGQPVHGVLRRLCDWLAVGLVGFALLRPVWGEGAVEPAGPDVLVCLDVSRSMRARDVMPDRLGAAQREIEALAGVRDARVGLVVFAGTAELAVPLCRDLGSVAAIAATMDPSVAKAAGSDVGAAIEAAGAALQRSGSVAGSIVVLTDGEDFAGRGAQAAARARQQGFVVHCLGFGSVSGSKIVVDSAAGETFLRDAAGREVVSVMDPQSLGAVAAAGGGTFATAEPGALAQLHESALRPRALAAARLDPRIEPAHRFQWPLLAALLLWMLRRAMPERRR